MIQMGLAKGRISIMNNFKILICHASQSTYKNSLHVQKEAKV